MLIDCRRKCLKLGSNDVEVPFIDSNSSGSNRTEDSLVTVSQTVQIPANSVLLLNARVKGDFGEFGEGLIEDGKMEGKPNNVLVARSLCVLNDKCEVTVQVMNVGPMPVTLYKGTRIANFVPRQHVFLLEDAKQCTGVRAGKAGKGTFRPDLQGSKLTTEEKEKLHGLLEEFSELFDDGELGRTSKIRHAITTFGPPIRQPIRRLPVALKKTVQEEVQKMLKNKVIRPSTSPWSSPIIMVRKKDGSWRFCISISENLIRLRTKMPILCRVLTKPWNLWLVLQSFPLWISRRVIGKWSWKNLIRRKLHFPQRKVILSSMSCMPFGLTNAPSSFQRLMACVLSGLTSEQCLIYIDDIIVFSATFSEHLVRLRKVFQRVQDAGLKLKASKCRFVQPKVCYLGNIVSADGVEPDPAKIQAVIDYPVPTNVKELRQFLGLANYYRRFVQDYSRIASALFKLTQKAVHHSFNWTEQCTVAFKELKKKLTTPPILAFPRFDREFLLATDASDSAIGAVLSQVHDNGTEKVIAYWSRQLSKAERNYSTIEREALAIVKAVKEFYPYLYGHEFVLQTDHQPLVHLNNLRDVGGRICSSSISL